MDEDLPCYMEQSDGQSDTLTHEEHQQQQNHLEAKKLVQEQEPNSGYEICTLSYREDGGSNGIDEQRLFAVPAELRRLLLWVLSHFSEGVISRETVVNVEPPQDTGPRWDKPQTTRVTSESELFRQQQTGNDLTEGSEDDQGGEDPDEDC